MEIFPTAKNVKCGDRSGDIKIVRTSVFILFIYFCYFKSLALLLSPFYIRFCS